MYPDTACAVPFHPFDLRAPHALSELNSNPTACARHRPRSLIACAQDKYAGGPAEDGGWSKVKKKKSQYIQQNAACLTILLALSSKLSSKSLKQCHLHKFHIIDMTILICVSAPLSGSLQCRVPPAAENVKQNFLQIAIPMNGPLIGTIFGKRQIVELGSNRDLT